MVVYLAWRWTCSCSNKNLGVGETYSSEEVNRIAQDAIFAIDKRPHGIYGVDMTYDKNDIPNPTEINISRFFTTAYFFTKIFKDIALYNEFPSLPDGLWTFINNWRWNI